MSLPLNKIIGSIVKEFEKSSLSNDISREYLYESYKSHPLLQDLVPSRIRVAEANISMPLAFDNIGKEKIEHQEISKSQILKLILADKEEIPNKNEIAENILLTLKKNKQASLDNKKLADHILSAVKVHVKDIKLSEINKKNLEILQMAFLKKPTTDQEPKFTFRTEELEKMEPDRIFRMDFKIIID